LPVRPSCERSTSDNSHRSQPGRQDIAKIEIGYAVIVRVTCRGIVRPAGGKIMSRRIVVAIGVLASVFVLSHFSYPSGVAKEKSAPPRLRGQTQLLRTYGNLPLSFERNRGQTDARVRFLSRGRGYALFLTDDGATLTLQEPAKPAAAASKLSRTEPARYATLRVKLDGASHPASVSGEEQLPGRVNYFIGNDPSKWRADVPTYAQVKYRSVYPGVDVVYHGSSQRLLEYDFQVAPNADPRVIALSFEGADRLRLNDRGDLSISTPGGEVIERAPIVYQEVDGRRRDLSGRYVRRGARQVGFEVAGYDPRIPLVIDPVLVYSTYLGGNGVDLGGGIAVDSSGNTYVAGQTSSTNFPTTAGAFQTSYAGGTDAFVAKLNASGTALVYSTYLGGSGTDVGAGIAVDSSSNAYLIGYTQSTDFPITPGAFQTTFGGGVHNAFVTKLNASGSALIYSTYLGGSGDDQGRDIALDSLGDACLTGLATSANFPTTPGAFQTTFGGGAGGFVTKVNSTGTGLVYSTYLAGSPDSGEAEGIAVDSSGNAYVTGSTYSTNFSTTAGAFQTTYAAGRQDAFVTKLNATGTALVYSTYLGGGYYDSGNGIAVDSSGNAYVAGSTSSADFPTTPGAFQTSYNGGVSDGFVTKLNATGTALVYSTYLGGSGGQDGGNGIAVDSSGDAYVTGSTFDTDFPTTAGAFQTTFGGVIDAFVTKLNAGGTALIYSTYLGGSAEDNGTRIRLDSSGNAYSTGLTFSTDFPTTPGAFQTTFGGGVINAFVAKFSFGPTCSVTYNGTLNGNLNISSGLTCIINGTVTGNVTENGGGLYTSSATIGGNLQITGGGTFSMASTDVNGDLQIQNIPAGSAQNQICGTRVKGNLTFHNNGTAVAIGTTSASCPGNTIGNDLQVNNNTAAVQVFDDTAGGNLQCQNNSSITGGRDTAKSLQGQCAAF